MTGDEIVGIDLATNSDRRESHNTSLLRAAALLPPPGVRLDLFKRLDDLLGYNEDSAHDRVCPRLRACERRSRGRWRTHRHP
jgi:hypothetical protein